MVPFSWGHFGYLKPTKTDIFNSDGLSSDQSDNEPNLKCKRFIPLYEELVYVICNDLVLAMRPNSHLLPIVYRKYIEMTLFCAYIALYAMQTYANMKNHSQINLAMHKW